MAKVTQVDFVPKEMVSYSKETQTPTDALTHADQKAGKHTNILFLFSNLYPGWIKSVSAHVPEEEDDEEITVPPPAEETQEQKDEQGEQQEEGKDRSLSHVKCELSVNGLAVNWWIPISVAGI